MIGSFIFVEEKNTLDWYDFTSVIYKVLLWPH